MITTSGAQLMKTMGIRQAKAKLSELVRDAAKGECSIVTDSRKPVAMIGPPPHDLVETKAPSSIPIEDAEPLSDPAAFREALFSVPFLIEFPF
jgi:antitoxin (DNA-binding transcriptional repressor) of toxin-antitoxin stability system